jgi:hypothetical protein
MSVVWQQIHGVESSSGDGGNVTGRHGTGIAYVKVTPSGKELSTGSVETIHLDKNLGFIVGVENSGDFAEQNVKVRLRIVQNPPYKTIEKTATIAQIFNGTQQEAVFPPPFTIEDLVKEIPIKVDVYPVPGEVNTLNNSATYKVIFGFE